MNAREFLQLVNDSTRDYYEEKIDRLERTCDEATDRLREITSLLEPGED